MKKINLNLITVINLFALSLILHLSSCKTQNKDILPYSEAIDKYILFENLPALEQMKHIASLDTIINSLKSEIQDNPENWETHYFYAMALSDRLNGDSDILDFEKISLDNTKKVSKALSVLIGNTNLTTKHKHSAYSKMTQIWGNLAVNYVINGVADSADFALLEGQRQGGFQDASLEYCRNVLNSLDANAILFVGNSIDLYNFMFLQCQENTRIDVSLISIDMLENQWYAKWLNFLPNMTSPTNTNCSDAKLGDLYRADSTKYKASSMNIADERVTITPNGVHLNNYLYAPHAVMFEVMKHNAVRRPIYFTHSAALYTPGILGINQNIASEGLVFKLLPKAKDPILLDKAISNLLNKYKYEKLKSNDSRKDIDFHYYIADYKTAFIQAILFISQNMPEREELSELVHRFDEVFPEKTNPRTKDEAGILSNVKNIINNRENISAENTENNKQKATNKGEKLPKNSKK